MIYKMQTKKFFTYSVNKNCYRPLWLSAHTAGGNRQPGVVYDVFTICQSIS